MRYLTDIPPRLRPLRVVILLLLIAGTSVSCRADNLWASLTQREAHASEVNKETNRATSAYVVPNATPTTITIGDDLQMPTVTPQPTQSVPPAPPAPSSSQLALESNSVPRSESDAASKVIPIQKSNFPKGPRKPPPTRLIIPSIGVDTKVIELATVYNQQGELVWETAAFAAGHHAGTPNPGEPGNTVISGHISSIREGEVFKRLPEIKVGTGVVVQTGDRNYLYQVVDKRVVEPTQIDVMNSTAEETLTLITCVPDKVYTHRLIVTGKRI